MSTMKATMPIIRSGAVSPSACAMPSMVPVMMPGIASGGVVKDHLHLGGADAERRFTDRGRHRAQRGA